MTKSTNNSSSEEKFYVKEYLEGFKDGFISAVTDEKILARSIVGSATLCANSIAVGQYKSVLKLSVITIGLVGIGNGMTSGKKRRNETKFATSNNSSVVYAKFEKED